MKKTVPLSSEAATAGGLVTAPLAVAGMFGGIALSDWMFGPDKWPAFIFSFVPIVLWGIYGWYLTNRATIEINIPEKDSNEFFE